MKKLLILLILFSSTLSLKAMTDDEMELYESILCMNFDHPEIVWAQAILETGHLKSKLYVEHNNLFGMRFPKKRFTFAIERTKNGYSSYSSRDSSLTDYLVWQNLVIKKRNHMTSTSYYKYLDRVYCDTRGYSKQLKKLLRKNKGDLDAIKRMYDAYNNYLETSKLIFYQQRNCEPLGI